MFFLPSDEWCHSVTRGEEGRWRADSLTLLWPHPSFLYCSLVSIRTEKHHMFSSFRSCTGGEYCHNNVKEMLQRSVFMLTFFWLVKCIIVLTSCSSNSWIIFLWAILQLGKLYIFILTNFSDTFVHILKCLSIFAF